MMFPAIKVVSAFLVIHMWYENECCASQDCHPVSADTVKELKDGVVVSGFGLLQYSDPRLRWSRDDSDHLCVSKAKNLVCVYRKPKDM